VRPPYTTSSAFWEAGGRSFFRPCPTNGCGDHRWKSGQPISKGFREGNGGKRLMADLGASTRTRRVRASDLWLKADVLRQIGTSPM
jgi:hypothetical protein